MVVRTSPLLDFLAAVRRVVRRRELAAAALWSAAGCVGLAVVAAGLAGWTARGDVAAPSLVVCAGLVTAGLCIRGLRRTRALAGTLHRTALTIAQIRRPLTLRRGADPPIRADASLRREILGATELVLAEPGGQHSGSQDLAAAYVRQVEDRLPEVSAGLAAPPARLRAPALATALAGLLGVVLAGYPEFGLGVQRLLAAEDARPPAPPEPVWSSLALTLRYPAYSGRVQRQLVNPSGAVRALAGTDVDVELAVRRPARAVQVIVVYDQGDLPSPPPPERSDLALGTDGLWRGNFRLRGPGSWHVLAEPDDGGSPQRSAPMALEIEGDEAPEVELLPLPRTQAEPSELDRVELRFKARDDFGIASAVLVFEGPDKKEVRLDAGAPPPRARAWQHRYAWDLSSLPLQDRGQLTYWIEVRDNDPGLGLVALPDPPGKPARSAKMTLKIRDQETEHAENLESLAALRDAAVDLLARRMLTEEPGLARPEEARPVVDAKPDVGVEPDTRLADVPVAAPRIAAAAPKRKAARWYAAPGDPLFAAEAELAEEAYLDEEAEEADAAAMPSAAPAGESGRLAQLRELLSESGRLLAAISAAIDALSVDTLAPQRDAAVLTAIHRRLIELHRRETGEHEVVPPGSEYQRPQAIGPALAKLMATNRLQLAQLEDEIIRLDDLVDGEVLAQIEQLVARLQASQQKLVDLLEKLKAGDESVRGEVDQLQQRSREDLRRLSEARAKLNKELGQEFLNLDAFESMAEQMRQQDVGEQLRQGNVDGALERARGALQEIRKLRDGVQKKMADDVPTLSPEERARIELMRELSRMQDEETGMRSESRALHEQWRAQAKDRALDEATTKQAAKQAAALSKALDAINDARLGRDARRALEDAREHLQRVAAEMQAESPKALSAAEASRAAAQAIERALTGAGEDSQERRQLGPARDQAGRLRDLLESKLPTPEEGLDDAAKERFGQLAERQKGLQGRARELLQGPGSRPLPEHGKQALRGAVSEMESSAGELVQRRGGQAIERQGGALGGLQRALDSLRESSSAPQTSWSPEDVSTETERDRSLRDELMEAMKERAPEGFGESVERYYEELLR